MFFSMVTTASLPGTFLSGQVAASDQRFRWPSKKFFAERNRPILATDIECHLRFFEDALKFDRLDEQDFPVSKTVN